MADEDEDGVPVPEEVIQRCMAEFGLTRAETLPVIEEYLNSPEAMTDFKVMFMELMAKDAGDPIWPGEDPGWLLGPPTDPGPG
jgi:hypothetical protein